VARRALAAWLLAFAGAAGAADDALGTLFFTPEERARLDSERRGEEPSAPGAAGTPAAPRQHTLTGFVQRSDGRTTVWIDGRAVSVPAHRAPRLDPRIVQDESARGPALRVEPADAR
jgi:hypothetical protein